MEVLYQFELSDGLTYIAIPAVVLFGLVTNAIMVFIAWRVMRTHERIAADLRVFMNRQSDHTKQ